MSALVQEDTVRQALVELEQVEQAIRDKRRACGMDFYVPNAMQLWAHQSAARTLIYCGGNRSGKTTLGAMELCWHLTRRYPAWYSPVRRFNHPIKAVVVATEFPIIERAIEPKLRQYLPQDYYKIRRTPQGYAARLTCKDGSTVDFLTNEMSEMAFESADWDFYWGDEPQQKSRYFAIRRGLLDRQGLTVLTFTPLIEPWMKEGLIDIADGKLIEVFTVTLYDNHQDIQGHVILPLDSIKQFEAELPEDVRRTRVYGQFFHLRGIVYTEYRSAIHERLWTYEYPDPVVFILDPHERKPHCGVWAWVNRLDDLHVDREVSFHGSLQELKKHLLLTEAQAGYNVRRRLIDPNFGMSPDAPGSNQTVITALGRAPWPMRFGEANDDKEAGRFAVKEYLHFDETKPLSITNKPKLWFRRGNVPLTTAGVQNYQYDDWKGKLKDDRDVKEKEKPKGTDFPDCIRYLCLNRPTFDSLTRQPRHELREPVY